MRQFNRREFLAEAMGVGVASAGNRLFAKAQAAIPAVRYQDQRRFEVVHRAWFRNGDFELNSLELWIPVPQDELQQSVHRLKVEPRVPLVDGSKGLVKVAKYYGTRNLARPGEVFRLEVSYQIAVRAAVPDWDVIQQYDSMPYRKDRFYRLFTQPEKKIESDSPKIIHQAKQLKENAKTPLAIARSAYHWVLENTGYRMIGNFGGAIYCLESGCGECSDYSALFVALCRAAGVPARLVSGFWADETNGWHCWAEFMLPSGDWIPVDAAIGDHGRSARRYYFGSSENRRVALCRAVDIDLVGSRLGQRQREYLQHGACWWQGREVHHGQGMPEVRFQVTGRELRSQAETERPLGVMPSGSQAKPGSTPATDPS